MQLDAYGLEISTSSPAARDLYVDGIDRQLAGVGGSLDALVSATEADPAFALPHAAMARIHQTNARPGEALAAIEAAEALAADTTERERSHIAVQGLLTRGQAVEGFGAIGRHLETWPTDAFVLAPASSVFGLIGFSGRQGREPEQLEYLDRLAPMYGDDWWFRSFHAFAHVETGQWEKGRDMVMEALEVKPRSAHSAHVLAHALYEGGRNEEALDFLGNWLPDLDHDATMYCHTWWHYALLLMGTGQAAEALATYELHCAPGRSPAPPLNVMTDGASFLWRCELAGIETDPAAWEKLMGFYEATFAKPGVFLDAHAGLPYIATGRTDALATYIDTLRGLVDAGRLPDGDMGLVLTQAFAAFAQSRWAQVIDLLEPRIDEVVRIGGSRAQRDLAVNTLLAAYVRAGRHSDATDYIESSTDRIPSRPVAGLAA